MQPALWIRRFPWSILVAAALLLALGCLGIARYAELTEGTSRFFRQQVAWSVLALAASLGVSLFNYRILHRWSYAFYVVAIVLLVAVYLFPPVNGAQRWIRLGPLGLQPSEFAKVAFVLALACYLTYRQDHRTLFGLAIPLGLALVPALLVLKEPDLGTAVLFLPVLLVMLCVAGARRGDLARLLLAGLVLLPLIWTQMSREQRSRVTALFEQPPADQRPSDDAYHLHQAKRMFASGSAWGSLLMGQLTDDTAAYQLPEAHSDFILCVLGERLGLEGLALVLGLYAWLVWQGVAIAARTREPFGRLLATGLTGLVGVEVLVNTMMTVGLAPVTGMSLPLVSYGGSGLLAHGLALGLIASVGLRPGYEVTAEPFRWRPSGDRFSGS